jgi:glycosyltransferase involved in cell wall biosynthesis
MHAPSISIITPSYNQGDFIEETVKSVLNQDVERIQHIVVDGGSTDSTIDVLSRYPHLTWISEPDRGQSHAFNKGLEMATGEVVGWINSDDFYEPDVLAEVVSHFEDESVQWVVGNCAAYYDSLDYILPYRSPNVTHQRLLNNPTWVRQPGTFYRRGILKWAGGLNEQYQMCMDYDLWLRLLKRTTPLMVDRTYSYFRIHADQKTTAGNLSKAIRETDRILASQGVDWIGRKRSLLDRYRYWLKMSVKQALLRVGLIDERYRSVPLSSADWKAGTGPVQILDRTK